MNDSGNTLLAFLLTLPELEPPLTSSEQKSLRNAGLELQRYPEDWEDIKPDLVNIVEKHDTRSQVFAANQEKLKSLNDDTIRSLLTEADRDLASSSGVQSKERGVKPTGNIDAEDDTNTINNLSVRVSVPVIADPEPEKAAETVLDKFKKFFGAAQ